ncbi:MAG: Asp23/Gls24 family envelope stress response protein [Clostridia bacterium]|nr:Asp23/Gls24 family envelope stress response protein [Clostridia bacterium]
MNNKTELSINTEVLARMAEIAAKEVEGVAGLAKKAIDLKSAVKTKTPFTGVKVESVNGALKLNVYICVRKDAVVNEVAEKVQSNVKDKIQTMTGTAVTQVNVSVADVELEAPVEE